MSVDYLGPAYWWVGAASVLPAQVLTAGHSWAWVRILVPNIGWAEAEAEADIAYASFRH